jgi:hypothetical protein
MSSANPNTFSSEEVIGVFKFGDDSKSVSIGSIQTPPAAPKEGCRSCKALNELFASADSGDGSKAGLKEEVINGDALRAAVAGYNRRMSPKFCDFYTTEIAPHLLSQAHSGYEIHKMPLTLPTSIKDVSCFVSGLAWWITTERNIKVKASSSPARKVNAFGATEHSTQFELEFEW